MEELVATGNDLRVRWRLGGGRSGTWQSCTFDTPDEAAQARALVQAYRHSVDKETVYCTVKKLPQEPKSAGARVTVAELIEPYLMSKHQITPGFRERNRRAFRFATLPFVGHLPVNRVTADEVDKIIRWLSRCDCTPSGVRGPICSRRKKRPAGSGPHRDGLSKRTVDRYYTSLLGLFRFAVDRGLRADNPVQAVDWQPQSLAKYNTDKKEEVHFYMSRDQYRILRSRIDPRYAIFLDLLVYTGMRYSEATALTVGRVHIEPGAATGEISVVAAWKKDEGAGFYVGLPKGNAVRVVDVESKLIDKLKPLLVARDPRELVFTAPRGGRLESANFWSEIWNPAVVAAMRCDLHPVLDRGQRIASPDLCGPRCGDNGGFTDRGRACKGTVLPGWNRCAYHLGPDPKAVSSCECWDRRLPKAPLIHDLRHTHVSWSIQDGQHLLVISKRLGHSSIEMTEAVYAGILPEVKRAAVLTVDD